MKIFNALMLVLVMFIAVSRVGAQETVGAVDPQGDFGELTVVVDNPPVPAVSDIPDGKTEKIVIEPESNISVEIISPPVVQAPEGIQTPEMGQAAFQQIKKLAGRWQGVGAASAKNEDEKIDITYEVTAGGKAVMERIFPGTPQEMVTMYFQEKGALRLIHFCMLGNRPVMELVGQAPAAKGKDNVYEFIFVPQDSIDPAVDTHMHSLKLTLLDADHLRQEWTMYEAGKAVGTHVFHLSRVAAAVQ